MGDQPFLTIITRTHNRPTLLRRCVASVTRQTCEDYQLVVLFDDIGRGTQGSMEWMASEPEPYTGRYIFCLDDDNELIDDDFVGELRQIADEHDPDVIIFKVQHPTSGELPRYWGMPPRPDYIDLGCYAMKADRWRQFARLLHSVPYSGDFEMINAAYPGAKIAWVDRVFVRLNQVGRGEPEKMFADWHTTLRENVPDLFVGGKRILYVGANRCALPVFSTELRKAGNDLHLLEIWGPNVEHFRYRDTGRFDTITQGDVRQLPPDLGAFDAVFWWHGPEHLEPGDWPGALATLEQIAPLVVVGCPWGVWEQDANDGNEYEIHRSTIYPADLEGLGYEVVALGREDEENGGTLIAWKGETMAKRKIEPVNKYDGCYVKLANDRAFWAVDDGTRRLIRTSAEVNADRRPVEIVTEKQLNAIPVQ